MNFNLDPTLGGVDTPQTPTPRAVNPPSIAPSQQPTLWRGLLRGALLGLMGGSQQTGPESNAAGSIGAGIRDTLRICEVGVVGFPWLPGALFAM
jgi:hypothetical protein